MLLSIITINYNNAAGLEKTMASVNFQTSADFEHIIVDGGSTDGSVAIIKKLDDGSVNRRWVSEPDKGIYNAMNKGIGMATGRYVQFLNSGDYLIDNYVIEKILESLRRKDFPPILYGNMIVITKKGRLVRSRNVAGRYVTPWILYSGALPHSSAYFQRELFQKYGMYDESMKIVSDWEWYFNVIYHHDIQPKYSDIDVSCFNSFGISENSPELNARERRMVIEKIMPPQVLPDYDYWKPVFTEYTMLQRHSSVMFLHKCLVRLCTIIEKITLRTNSRALKRELRKKGIVLR